MLLLLSVAQATVIPSNVLVETLDNGVTAVVLEQADTDLVAVQTWMRVGARNEYLEGTTGYAHFFEHLMFQGTQALSGADRKQELMLMSVNERVVDAHVSQAANEN